MLIPAPAFASLTCEELLDIVAYQPGEKRPLPTSTPLKKALAAVRNPITPAEFNRYVEQLALYQISAIEDGSLEGNPLFRTRPLQPSIEAFTQNLRDGGDTLVLNEVNRRLDRIYSSMTFRGKPMAENEAALRDADSFVLFTHMTEELQADARRMLSEDARFRGLHAAWLVSAASPRLQRETVRDAVSVIWTSEGGEMRDRLRRRYRRGRTVYLGGGALEECMAQTIADLDVDRIVVLMPLTYVELDGGQRVSLSRLRGETLRGARTSALEEIEHLMDQEGYYLGRAEGGVDGAFAPNQIYRHPDRRDRPVTIEFAP